MLHVLNVTMNFCLQDVLIVLIELKVLYDGQVLRTLSGHVTPKPVSVRRT
jgi:hypothetical protein